MSNTHENEECVNVFLITSYLGFVECSERFEQCWPRIRIFCLTRNRVILECGLASLDRFVSICLQRHTEIILRCLSDTRRLTMRTWSQLTMDRELEGDQRLDSTLKVTIQQDEVFEF